MCKKRLKLKTELLFCYYNERIKKVLLLCILLCFKSYAGSDFFHAVKTGDLYKVVSLINKGIDKTETNQFGQTALFFSGMKSAQVLIDHGIDIYKPDKNGNKVLTNAVYKNFYNLAKFLLDRGYDVNDTESYKQTALFSASSPEMARLLIAKGIDPYKQDKFGNTALHRQVKKNNEKVIKLLLEFGMETDHKNKKGQTALDIAKEKDFENISKLLESDSCKKIF